MRLIDADALIKRWTANCNYAVCIYDGAFVVETIKDAPTVVRCKDCKHYQFAENRAFGMPVKRCEITGFEDVDDFDFCSRAERRSDETD